jgi:hypothetical protein
MLACSQWVLADNSSNTGLGQTDLRASFARKTWRATAANFELQEMSEKVGQEVGPTSTIYSSIPMGMQGPTCIFWPNLTPFSL